MPPSISASKPDATQHNLRVAMVVGQFRPSPMGGAERQAEILAHELRNHGVDVEIFTMRPRGAAPGCMSDGIPVHRIWSGYGPATPYTFMYMLYRTLLSHGNRFDLIHVHQGWTPAFAAVAAGRKMQKPVLVKCGNSGPRFDLDYLERHYIFGARMANTVARDASCFISLNDQADAQLRSRNIESGRIAHVPNGIGIKRGISEEERREARNQLQLGRDDVAIVYVGSLSAKKDLSTLIKALAATKSPTPLTAYLVGDGPLLEQLQSEAKHLNIQHSVHFTGRLPFHEVRGYLAAADLFVLPSETEGLSNALLEAMMASLPCVVSNIPGNRALVKDSENTGLTFRQGDAESLASVIDRTLADSGLRLRVGKNARRKIMSEYGIQSVAERYVRIYVQLLARNT